MFRDISLNKKLITVLFLMFLFVFVELTSIYYFGNLQKTDAAIVDAAGRNRMLSQRIAFYAEQIVRGGIDKKSELNEIINLHNTSLYAIKDGGVVPGIADNIVLPATPDDILPLVLSSEELWIDYKLNAEIISELKLPFPPLPEQHTIADFLDAKTSQFDTLMEKIRDQISYYQEYRTTLISASVTGKIDVRAEGN